MARRVAVHPKIEVVWEHECMEAFGREDGTLAGIHIRNRHTGEESDLPVGGLFFAIGHAPATAFLGGQLELDSAGYIVTTPDSTATSVPGVFAAGDVMDRKWRQAVTSAGAGCIAAIEAQHFLQSNQDGADTSFIGQTDLNAAWVAQMQQEAQERQASGDKAAPAAPVPTSA
ncbi:hypothetical protein CHLNCDRAFT_31503 [Chlorella variabilis]|uniref:FAD/NAD(P)-binding domain-containing protein n=1 Tax=Chlorella variabilis TaxID=554065 RepID=E1ZH22_CHLVA|nr:hypothetical protein CHLNCDRAFT_31503 [Chlorella variabilis]EFN55041.1 hypothetical protein CHLNCDRAFT_31503 [Chlorella variabilis]|eukprot:XP_005847143.1 hypothetical protein CHLNCDRAFT_31503 [Chlorella variabilis]